MKCPNCQTEIDDKEVMRSAMSAAGKKGRGAAKARPSAVASANASAPPAKCDHARLTKVAARFARLLPAPRTDFPTVTPPPNPSDK